MNAFPKPPPKKKKKEYFLLFKVMPKSSFTMCKAQYSIHSTVEVVGRELPQPLLQSIPFHICAQATPVSFLSLELCLFKTSM
jgi:hypothetical protein